MPSFGEGIFIVHKVTCTHYIHECVCVWLYICVFIVIHIATQIVLYVIIETSYIVLYIQIVYLNLVCLGDFHVSTYKRFLSLQQLHSTQ